MTSSLPWIATRQLASSDPADPPIEIQLGAPEPVSEHEWRCPYRFPLGPAGNAVRYAHGEDALQSLLCALIALRNDLDRDGSRYTWAGTDTSGIPKMIPQFFGVGFAARLEAMVEAEVSRFAAEAKAHSADTGAPPPETSAAAIASRFLKHTPAE
jgi:hypothetical protein